MAGFWPKRSHNAQVRINDLNSFLYAKDLISTDRNSYCHTVRTDQINESRPRKQPSEITANICTTVTRTSTHTQPYTAFRTATVVPTRPMIITTIDDTIWPIRFGSDQAEP